tara:strand:- start:1285 stop:2268 length:984 start_codon:yes stop_codon:yes gene_type:complete
MVVTITIPKLVPDEVMNDIEGEFLDFQFHTFTSNQFPMLITEDVDVYKDNGELLLKFRKNVISQKLCEQAFQSYKTVQMSRGAASRAGPINEKSIYWSKRTVVRKDKNKKSKKWMTKYITPSGEVSKMMVSNPVFTHVLGYYEKTPFLKMPCRLTSFTRRNLEKYKSGLPFIERIDELYKKLVPDRYKIQKKRADLRPKYRINNTAFTTITVNRNFRTALHKDAGDYKPGFGNVTVLERGKYHGGYTILPQYGIAVNVRQGDFLAMDVHEWHCNSPLYETKSDKKYNETLKPDYNLHSERGVQGENKRYTRLSFVCYVRDKIIECNK